MIKLSELVKEVNRDNAPPDSWKEEDKVSNVDLKGSTICKAKGCNNALYGWTSAKDPKYCADCV